MNLALCPTRLQARLKLGALALVLVAAACTPTGVGIGGDGAASSQTNDAAPPASAPPASVPPASDPAASDPATSDPVTGSNNDATASNWTPGPMEVFLQRIGGHNPNNSESPAELRTRIERESRQREEYIAACMGALGFTYTPVPQIVTVTVAEDVGGPQVGTLEWAQLWGFAMSTDPFGAGANTSSPGAVLISTANDGDPNQALVAVMSEAEREAWNEALFGGIQAGDTQAGDNQAGDAMDGQNWDPMLHGCLGQATAAQFDPTPNQFTALEDELNQMWVQTQTDPRMAALNAAWAGCLAAAGFPGFTDEISLWNQLNTEWGIIQGWEIDPNAPPNAPAGQMPPAPDPAAIAAFQEREISLAVTHYNCRQQVNFDLTAREISHDIQQQFVDQHRAELEAWATYMETQRG